MDDSTPAPHDRTTGGIAWWVWAAALLLCSAVLNCARLGDKAVVSEEVRWAEVAREMKQSGDYLRPTINGRVYFDKPVGSYWLIVLASQFTGTVDEATARLPAALAGVLGVWVLVLLARRWWADGTALVAGAILATGFGYVFYARRATADVETVVGVLVAVWLFARNEHGPGKAWVVLLWVWMAAVSLAKGLLGFALPCAVFAVYGVWAVLAEGRPIIQILTVHRWFWNRWTLLAVPLAVLVYLLPFLLASQQQGVGVGLGMVWRENVQRFIAPHNHLGPIWLYVGVIFVLAAPWSLFLPAALLPSRTPRPRLVLAYFWAVFLFFTLSASRRSYYLLPVLPPTAMFIAQLLTAKAGDLTVWALRLRRAGWWLAGVLLALAGVLLIPPAWVLPAPYNALAPLPGRWMFALGWLAALGAAVLARRRTALRVPTAVGVVFATFLYAFLVVLPALDDLRPRRDFLNDVRELTDVEPGSFALYHASDTVFDLDRIVPEYETAEELRAAVLSKRIRWLLLPRRRLGDMPLSVTIRREEAMQPWEPPNRLENKLVLLEVRD